MLDNIIRTHWTLIYGVTVITSSHKMITTNSNDQHNSAAQGINHNWSYSDPTNMNEDILESL